ncbi:UvrB/UvrC motif-containing protein [bacterium]|nr:UvrB/UvrC motif-containing protein [bacterium]
MSRDISDLLSAWSVDDFPVRVIDGDDGRPKLQRRLALGILQLEMDGRPDGQTPFGDESYFDHFQRRCDSEAESFYLTSADCQKLASEAILYFQRRLCFFDLGDFERAARDADRNLEVFSFARKHALDEEDAWMLDQYRGFVLSHRARAKALSALKNQDFNSALAAVDEGFAKIRTFLDEYDIDEEMAAGDELRQLRRLRDTITGHPTELPAGGDIAQILRDQLRSAIENEQYERAAKIRDQLASLESPT